MTIEDKIELYKFDMKALRNISLKQNILPLGDLFIPQAENNIPAYVFALDTGVINEIAANPARFTIVGENHPDETIEPLIDALIGTGNYSTIYLEALDMGDYKEQGDKLKRDGGVYGWNPAKYDRIIRHAMERGIEIRGIDGNRKNTCEDTARWADYILSTSKGKSLVVTGAAHVDYGTKSDEKSQLLPPHIAGKGIPAQEIVTIAFFDTEENWALEKGQIYRLSELPDNQPFSYFKKEGIGDYVFVRAKTPEELKMKKLLEELNNSLHRDIAWSIR